MKKYIIILIAGLSIFIMPHLSFADTTFYDGVQSQGGVIHTMYDDHTLGGDIGIDINGVRVADAGIAYVNSYNWTGLNIPFNAGDNVTCEGIFNYWGTGYCIGNYFTGTLTPSGPSLTGFIYPTSTGINQTASQWNIVGTNMSTSTMYRVDVVYSNSSGTIYDGYLHDDFNLFVPTTGNGDIIVPVNTNMAYPTVTGWHATAMLFNTTSTDSNYGIGFATDAIASTTINFSIGTSTNPFIYTGITPYPSSSNKQATSTCAGYDFGCQIGNVVNNTINWIFGINEDEIAFIGGVNFHTTPPWSYIGTIQDTFNQESLNPDTNIATTSISMNLGNGSTSIEIFSSNIAKEFIPKTLADLIKSILYSCLVLLGIFGIYKEIRAIFKTKT